jgi:hypothetical protein
MSLEPTLCAVFSFFFVWLGNKCYSEKMTKISEDGSEMDEFRNVENSHMQIEMGEVKSN